MDRQLKYPPHYRLRNASGDNLGLTGPNVLRQPTTQSTAPLPTTYIQAATSNNTRKAYRMDIQHFQRWGGMLPTSTEEVVRYLHGHAETLNPRTLSRRLTALKHWHSYQGFADPTIHPLVRKTLTGIQNVHGKPKEKAAALQLEHLQQMVDYLKHANTTTALRDNALIQLGFFGAFRRSELVNIHWEQIDFVPEGIEILIPRSKTDQAGEGQVCAIPTGHEQLCPVGALKAWQAVLDVNEGPVFRAIDRRGVIHDKALSPGSVNQIVKQLAQAIGLANARDYSSHSLRRGFATAASRQGAPFHAIMRQGRWRHQGTVLGYIEAGQRFEENAAKVLLSETG